MLFSALLWLSQFLICVGSVASSPSFPEQLSAEEEKKYVARMMAGDEKARNRLIEHNLRLVAHICKKYAGNGRDMDDLISIGTIGLIKAVQTFDPQKGRPIGTYAARCIENEVLMSVRAEKKTRGEVAMEDVIGTDKDGNQIHLMDLISAKDISVEEQAATRIAVEKLLLAIGRVLTKRERMIIELRYGLAGGPCRTQREIAEKLGISRSYVSRIETKALRKLAEEIEASHG